MTYTTEQLRELCQSMPTGFVAHNFGHKLYSAARTALPELLDELENRERLIRDLINENRLTLRHTETYSKALEIEKGAEKCPRWRASPVRGAGS